MTMHSESPINGHDFSYDDAGIEEPVVIIVDDDDLMRSALLRLFAFSKLVAEAYASGAEFLENARLERAGCIILDVCMPGMTGLEIQRCLKQRNLEIPIIFLTGASDIPIAVSAMRAGAMDFVEKPFDRDDLLARVRNAIDRNEQARHGDLERREVLRRLQTLTPREFSVMELLVAGKTNKEIARILGPSFRTIEAHRRNVMEKMDAHNLADLVRTRMLVPASVYPPRGGARTIEAWRAVAYRASHR